MSPDCETYLSKLYTSQPLSLPEDIKAFVQHPKDIDSEIEHLRKYVAAKSPDLTRVVFLMEVVGKCLRKHSDFREYMKLLVDVMETHRDYQHAVFCLRLIRSVVGSRFYAPLSFHLLRILRDAVTSKNIVLKNKTVDYDSINPCAERTRSEEHQMFVIGEVNALLRQHLSSFSKNIGFPELADVVIGELRKLKTGIYREAVGDMILSINKHREYILDKRSSMKLSGLNPKAIAAFEGSVERTL